MSAEPQGKGAPRTITLGKYAVLRHLANGGMGAVYKARDTRLGRIVALKVLPPALAANPNALERFKREARHAARLRHRNIVTLYECGEHQGTHYLVLEFVEGIDLHEYVNRKGKLDPDEALRILLQAAAALECAFEEGIVHRDIKPSNFLVTRKDGRLTVKLSDFGLSRLEREEEFRVTRSGTTVGTLDYMSPEQARDSGSADVRSDIYSLGCTYYHLLAGRPPFPEGGLAERIRQHIEDEPPDVRRFNPKVSEELRAVLNRMLAKQPEDRYQTPGELMEDLEAMAAGIAPVIRRDILSGLSHVAEEAAEGDAALPDTATEDSAEQDQALPWRWLLVGTAALVLAVSGLAVLLTQLPRRPPPPPDAGPLVSPKAPPSR